MHKIICWYRTAYFTLFFFVCSFSRGQVLVVDDSTDQYSLKGYCFHYESDKEDQEIEDVIDKDWSFLGQKSAMFGVSKKVHWVRVEIRNGSNKTLERFLYTPYHHINKLDAYVVQNKHVKSRGQLGTARKYLNKEIRSRGYPFKFILPPRQSFSVYLRLDHKHLPLRASLYLMSENKIKEINGTFDALSWLWKGVFLFALLISIVLFIGLRARLYLYYFLHNLGVLLFIMIETGDYFLFAESDPMNHMLDFKHLGNIVVLYFFPLFLNELTPVKKLYPLVWKASYLSIYILGFSMLICVVPWVKHTIFLSAVTYVSIVLTPSILILQLFFLIAAIRKKIKNAFPLLILYSMYVGTLVLTNSLPSFGIIEESPIAYLELIISSIFEVLTFSILIGREALNVYKERAELLAREKEYQRQMLKAIIEGEEKERNRVGRELHDMVGANLAIIKQGFRSGENKVKTLIDSTIDSIRDLSHGLVTPELGDDEFKDEIRELCMLFSNEERKAYCYFHQWEKISNPMITTHLYRIVQELLQNAIKHSSSTLIHLQFFAENRRDFRLMYDDNGVGFDFSKASTNGLGLKNIFNRVKLIGGKINFDTQRNGKGVTVLLEIENLFPLPKMTFFSKKEEIET